MTHDTIILGAGAAGLAIATGLKRGGQKPILIERGERPGWSWINRYDRLHLHTAKGNSNLPDAPFPASYPKYMHRDQLVAYYEDYARTQDFDIRFGHEATNIERDGTNWKISGKSGRKKWEMTCVTLVIATGYSHTPFRPEIDGFDTFTGAVTHSADYRNPQPYKGQDVLVVGMGNSGAEIALDLAEHGARPVLSVRSPVLIIPREVFGISIDTVGIYTRRTPPRISDRLNWPVRRLLVGNYADTGLRVPDFGPMTMIREQKRIPVIDVGTLAKLRSGDIIAKPGITRFDKNTAHFADGEDAAFDAVIFATGYRTGLETLTNGILGLLSEKGVPLASGSESAAPGLYFCGFNVTAGGMLREIRNEAAQVCAQILQKAH